MATIFVADGLRDADPTQGRPLASVERLREIQAYLYGGWAYGGWGLAPTGSNLEGFTGFYFTRNGNDGFGAVAQCDRLRSGLHAAMIVEA